MSQTTETKTVREVDQIVRGQTTSDGAGVRLSRIIGAAPLPDLDPFLLLDEFGSENPGDYIAGFPEHPHRGFETVTYMLAGKMRHRDNQGNTGLLNAGSVQWMTAGRGILHSEMPEQEEGLMRGFQLWVNLPAKDKLCAPRYQDIAPERIPETSIEGGRVRVLAGSFNGVDGPVKAIATQPTYFDVQLDRGVHFEAMLDDEHNAFIYAFEGSLLVGISGRALTRGELGVLGRGTTLEVNAGENGARFLLVAGRPLNEPIARYGPIVMNTQAELRIAFDDIRTGKFNRPE
ncbi:MAG: pirin family protein [Candidatus Eremiobacteraeota bacterium]|nr:pirin family protein [Candidatus Eremiobacteraeota bacterium]